MMLSDKEMHQRMAKGWRGGKPDGTICGQGSTMANTAVIRKWLPVMVEKYGIETVCDAGAGDMHWIKQVDWDVDYLPFDLIPRSEEVEQIDITNSALPECDAILCRMVLNHLWGDNNDTTRIRLALDLFMQSSSYLIATHFVGGGVQRTPQFARLDLTQWLGEPIELCRDGHEPNCRLALWELN